MHEDPPRDSVAWSLASFRALPTCNWLDPGGSSTAAVVTTDVATGPIGPWAAAPLAPPQVSPKDVRACASPSELSTPGSTLCPRIEASPGVCTPDGGGADRGGGPKFSEEACAAIGVAVLPGEASATVGERPSELCCAWLVWMEQPGR